MTDKVQAKQDLEFCSAELSKYQNLSRSGLTRMEMLTIDGIMIKLKERIKNLRLALHLQSEPALLHKDLKCKAPLIDPNLRRNLGKWST
ncbi:hypothetical protein [Acinetobacter indicus]|uniref:hypothetical protein n=1 Tax=Acinetobacter indicus TaxID=756892 RepID=UPI000CEC1339|nr:hypothetical protein [Acinetobacter indicus]